MSEPVKQAEELLIEVERELRRQDLWESAPPAVDKVQSSEPFAADTLHLAQWLQWIFIPRMWALLEAEAPLPGNCNIAPYAELVFAELEEDTDRLQRLIQAVDDLLG